MALPEFSPRQRKIITTAIAAIPVTIGLVIGLGGYFAGLFSVPGYVKDIKENMVTKEDVEDFATKTDFEYVTAMRVEKVSPDEPISISVNFPRRITVEGPAGSVVEETEFLVDQRPTFEPAALPEGYEPLGTIVLGPPDLNLRNDVKVEIDLTQSDLELLDPDLENLSMYWWSPSGWEPVEDIEVFEWKKAMQFDTQEVGYYVLAAGE